MLNFNHLYYFHVTASEGSVKAAADRLGLTQPTVSEQLRILERSLAVQLFERGPAGLRLTAQGREAFEHTTAMFLASDRLLGALGRAAGAPVIALRVGVSTATSRTMAADFLMPVLALDQCRPSIRMGEFNELLRDLRSHELDLAIGEGEPIEALRSGMDVALIDRPALVAVTRPDTVPGDNWQNLSLLEYRPSSVYYWEISNFLKERNLTPTSMGEVDDAFLMLEAAGGSSGFVAFVPRSVARDATKAGKVKPLATLSPVSAGVYAVYHSGEASQYARLAVEKLIECARQNVERN